MKKLILIGLISLCASCETPHEAHINSAEKFNVIKGHDGDEFYTVLINGCEYVVFNGSQKGGIIHAGNCKNHQ